MNSRFPITMVGPAVSGIFVSNFFIFPNSLECINFVFDPNTDVCKHCILGTFPKSSEQNITGMLLGWDSNPRPLQF